MDSEHRGAILDLTDGPPAHDVDVSSPEALAQALYRCISGPAEKDRKRDWDRLRSLFLPNARFTLVRWNAVSGSEEQVLRSWDVEGFIEAAKFFYLESSFYETQVWHRTEKFGNVAHVFSTYESRLDPAEEPVMRGINSIQTVCDGQRWWIAHLVWDLETAANPIPPKYLPQEE